MPESQSQSAKKVKATIYEDEKLEITGLSLKRQCNILTILERWQSSATLQEASAKLLLPCVHIIGTPFQCAGDVGALASI